ncbi:MAG: vWA domain-containing protein [Pirellulaceae bacterium]
MNLLCIKCGRGFSVTTEQFGTRGKCPHCNATVLVPHLNTAERKKGTPLKTPQRWIDRSFSGIIAVVMHLLVFGILAMTPWRRPLSGTFGVGDEVQIGTLPRQRLLTSEFEKLDLQTSDLKDSTDALDTLSLEWLNTPIAPESVSSMTIAGAESGGQQNEAVRDLTIQLTDGDSGGGQESFTDMVSRLKKQGLDIVILFDSTLSMGGELNEVKNQIRSMGGVLFKLVPQTRIGICAYRDEGDEFVTKGLPLTDDLGELVGFLSRFEAKGGGDKPEAVDEGLRWVLENNEFRDDARKVILVFGDAPPHANRRDDCLKLATDFRRTGGIVSTVTCRNTKPLEEFVEIAQLGGGESFLTSDQRQIMSRLVVLVFGSQHQEKVLELFRLLDD